MQPLSERLTIQFYEWENRCRGWYAYPVPVDLEPPFEPFGIHDVSEPYVDDGRVPSLFEWVGKGIKSLFSEKEQLAPSEAEQYDLAPILFEENVPLKALLITLPKGVQVKHIHIDQLLLMLSMSSLPVSFEIIGTHESIAVQFVCREPDYHHVRQQIKAYIPNAIITDGTLSAILPQEGGSYCIDFGLKEEFMRPLVQAKPQSHDPYVSIFGILEHLEEGEQAVLQVLFKGVVNPWAAEIMRSVTDGRGNSFFEDAPEMVQLAKEKVTFPLCGVTVRVLAKGDTVEVSQRLAYRLTQTVCTMSQSSYNTLVPLPSERYDPEYYAFDIYYRQSHRLGMLLNCKELALLVHLPGEDVVSEKLLSDGRKTKATPKVALEHGHVLGLNTHQGKETWVTVGTEHRMRHMHVIGATGTGKSTFLLNCIVQDMYAGKGVAVLDPHGDLIERVLEWVPQNRLQDVLIIDPADEDFPVAFNILIAHSEIEKNILSSDLVAVFRRLSTSWGDQMNSVFANAILAFLESSKGGTLLDLRKFLIEKEFRNEFLKTVSEPNVIYYWQKEFPLLKSGSIGPILTRLDSFLRPKLIRNMVAQPKGLDFEQLLDTGKIILVKLSQGLIGSENSYLLGTFVVAKLHQAALARQAKAREARKEFFVYIDEFQNFITPSMASILSGARKYGLGLILAHQDIQQLLKEDSELASSVMANAGIRACFRLGDTDAKRFEQTVASFDMHDLQNLETGTAIVRIERSEWDCSVSIVPLEHENDATAKATRESVITLSRGTYGTPKSEVEALFIVQPEVEPKPEQKQATETKQSEKLPEPEPKEIAKDIAAEPLEEIPTTADAPIDIQAASARYIESIEEQREVREHLYAQEFIKKLGEQRGFKVETEAPTPDGGRIDVVLTQNDIRIACEISVTNTVEYETRNLQKCIDAGFNYVVMLCNNETHLRNIKQSFETNVPHVDAKVHFCTLTDISEYLDTHEVKNTNEETRIRGYRVKTTYNPPSGGSKKKDSFANAVIKPFIKNNH